MVPNIPKHKSRLSVKTVSDLLVLLCYNGMSTDPDLHE